MKKLLITICILLITLSILLISGCSNSEVEYNRHPSNTDGSISGSRYLTTVEGCKIYRIAGNQIDAKYVYLAKCANTATVSTQYSRGKNNTEVSSTITNIETN